MSSFSDPPAGPTAAPATRLEDAALVARVGLGDEAALEALYQRYGGPCYRLARRLIGDDQLAEDVVQQVFLALWQRRAYDPARGALSTWLLAVTHHQAVGVVRSESGRRARLTGAQELIEAEAAGPGPDEQVWARLRAERTRVALRELSAEHREVLLLAYFGGYTQSEIAGMTGLPLGTVKSRTLHAMRRLRALLSADLGSSEGTAQ
jgi:RNA polymerase sigma-70 factor (ECF subfamily)